MDNRNNNNDKVDDILSLSFSLAAAHSSWEEWKRTLTMSTANAEADIYLVRQTCKNWINELTQSLSLSFYLALYSAQCSE